MAMRPERLTELVQEVAQERLSLRSGSPTDAQLGAEKLADLAVDYIPELVDEVRRLSILSVLPKGPTESVTGAMVEAAMDSKAQGEGPTTLAEYLDFSGLDTTRRVVKAAIVAALAAAPSATSISGGAAADVIPASAQYWKRCADAAIHDSERAFCANEAYNHLRNHVYALAAAPASVTSPQKLPVELEELLSAYADLAASHDDALPITAKADTGGWVGLFHNDGTPIEADQRLADFVAAACNFVGAGFVADMNTFAAADNNPAASVTSPVEPHEEVKAIEASRQQLIDSLNERPASMPVVSAALYLEQTGLLLQHIFLAQQAALPDTLNNQTLQDIKRQLTAEYERDEREDKPATWAGLTRAIEVVDEMLQLAPAALTNSLGVAETGGWVPVGERLPDTDCRVMVCWARGSTPGKVDAASFLLADQWERKNMFVVGGGFCDSTWFTHWCPMISAPADAAR